MNIVGAAPKEDVVEGVVEMEEIVFLWNVGTGANDCPIERIAAKITADTRTIVEIIVLILIKVFIVFYGWQWCI